MNDKALALEGGPQEHKQYLPVKPKPKYFSCIQFLLHYYDFKYISIFYQDCMWFTRPMVEHKFNNNNYSTLFALSLLLDRFEKEDQLFATQCGWWLASIIQSTEILLCDQNYKIFPSEY